jgi:hypothetical protein
MAPGDGTTAGGRDYSQGKSNDDNNASPAEDGQPASNCGL